MKAHIMKLTKEQWDNDTYVAPSGKRIVKMSSEMKLFGASICCGYGLYGTDCREKDGEYFCYYTTGSTCD